MTALPRGWIDARFGDVASVASNLVDPAQYPNAAHIAPNHIESGTGRLLPYRTVAEDGVTSPKHRFRAGQIVYSKIRPYLAKAAIPPVDGLCSADMYPIETSLDDRYLLHWMLSPEFTESAAQYQGRSVLPKINQRDLAKIPVPVPRPAEQRRIVEAIEERFTRLDAAVACIDSAERRLRVYDPQLLRSILGQDADWPEVHVGEVAALSLGKMLDSKQRTGLHPTAYLRNINVRWGRFDLDDLAVMDIRPEEFGRASVRRGDVVMCEGGEPGRCAVWKGDSPVAIQKALHRIRPGDDVSPDYLALLFRQMASSGALAPHLTGSTIKHLPKDRLKEIRFRLPPRKVQDAAVAEASLRLQGSARLHTDLELARKRAGQLRHSILLRAFSGGLGTETPEGHDATTHRCWSVKDDHA